MRPAGQSLRGQIIIVAVLGALFLAGDLAVGAISFYTDWLWFSSLGYESAFLTVVQAKVATFLVAALAFFVLALANLMIARTIMSRQRTVSIREERGVAYIVQLGQDVPRRFVTLLALLLAVGIGILMGMSASGQWETVLKFLNARSFGFTDPLFNQDIGFYFFTLPLYRFIQGWIFWALLATLVLTLAVYLVSIQEGNVALDPGVFASQRPAKLHIMLLAAAIALVMAASYRVQIFDLVYAARGATTGAGFTDATARQTALWAMLGIMVIIAGLFVVSGFRRGFGLPFWGVGLWLAAAVALGAIYPAIVQKLIVEPSELEKERPYIESSIRMTRRGFGLDSIQERDFRAEDAVTSPEINNSPDTVNNIRLWDHRPLKDTYNQIQAIRLYYEFNDVDIDRYTISARYRQVMLAARELSPEKLATQAQNWVTRRLQFTHGYGVAMSPVNEIVGEGLPSLLVRDIPPQGEVKIDKPQIYYGEKPSGYAIVKTTAQEFDYPRGDDNVYGSYQGDGGVVLDSFLKKLAFALYFREGNILFSQYLTPDSRMLYFREIQERVRKVTPFLMLDRDPYLVVADGQLFWIQDAYTTSTAYPYSAMYEEQTIAQVQTPQRGQQVQQVRTGRRYNYIRNSVKVVISAYDGSLRYFVSDTQDPMIGVYGAIFPGLFAPMSGIPDSLKSHVRYPEDFFKAQAEMYRTFHMQDPQVYYNREDLWSVPMELFADNRQPVEPYYLIMKLPGEAREEFLQMLPFTPSDKDNMIAWLSARSDGENYGKLLVFKYPKDKLIYGPMQLEARINQDPIISAQFTLWNQAGSRVTRGNLLVIPVGNSNLYVEPVYLQSDRGSIPELKRVIVSTGNKVVMEPTLPEALNKLFDGRVALGPISQPSGAPPGTPPGAAPPVAAPGAAPPGAPGAQPAPAAPATQPGLAELVRNAQDAYNRAQERLKAGDWAGYGEEQKKLEAALRALAERAR